MPSISEMINNVFPLSAGTLEKFTSILEPQQFAKGDLLVKEGKRSGKEFIITKGICRSFVLSPSGKEISLSFFLEEQAISPSFIRTNNEISILNVQALTDVEVFCFSTENLMSLMASKVDMRQWGNTVLQRELMLKIEKELSQASMTVQERLIAFRQRYGALENLIAHTHIASYLGITTISLSRLRKRLAGQ